MKTWLALTVLALSSLAAAAPDPCKLLTPGEVKAGLVSPTVTVKPDPTQGIPTCNFDFEGGGVSLGVTAGASKMLQGKSLLQMVQSGEGGQGFKGAKTIPGVGDEAVGFELSQKIGGVPQNVVTFYVRKADTLLVMFAVVSNHTAKRVDMQSVTLLAKRVLLRVH